MKHVTAGKHDERRERETTPGFVEDVQTDPRLSRKIIRFRELAQCGEEIWIEHEGGLYRLRETRQGKLILTK